MADALSSVNGPVRAEPSVQLHYQFHCERPRSYYPGKKVSHPCSILTRRASEGTLTALPSLARSG